MQQENNRIIVIKERHAVLGPNPVTYKALARPEHKVPRNLIDESRSHPSHQNGPIGKPLAVRVGVAVASVEEATNTATLNQQASRVESTVVESGAQQAKRLTERRRSA